MRVLALASRLERHAWTPGALATRLLRALTERGHEVTLVCDAAEDVEQFGCRVRAMRAYEHNQAARPGAVARWLEHGQRVAGGVACPRGTPRGHDGAEETEGHHVTLSLTRLVPAQVWMPLDPAAEAVLEDELACRPLVSRCMWFTRHSGVLMGRAVERDAVLDDARVERVLAFGPSAAQAACRAWPRVSGRVMDVGFVSLTEPLAGEEAERVRAESRARLHINPARRVVLVSLMRTVGDDLAAFFGALAHATAPAVRSGTIPVVVAVARDPYAVHDAACRAGCQRALRVVGQTERMDALLAACDAAAVPLAARPDAFRAGATGRFVASALRAGRPVVAAAGAPGEDLLEHRGVEAPGAVVEPTAEQWGEALRRLCDDEWLAARAVGAKAAGMGVGLEEWVGRVERALGVRVTA